jgi:oligopeptide/dipeptide ABC transporter ATP-binding protein
MNGQAAKGLLRVENLSVTFDTPDGEVEAVRSLGFALGERETLGIVGESGSGKTQAMLSLLGLLAGNGRCAGSAVFDGRDLLAMEPGELRRLRGNDISMIFQDPMTSLNPYLRIGTQLGQVVRAHEQVSRGAARARTLEMLEAVQIPEAAARMDRYPHELSGGMRQRVMIAASLLLNPRLLIADEPTTALDVTVQAQILELMRRLKDDFGTAIILITHDLGVVAGIAERVLVMQSGELREHGTVEDVFHRPANPYTQRLLAAIPRIDSTDIATDAESRIDANAPPLLDIDDLGVEFPIRTGAFGRRERLRAVNGVSLELSRGETLGIVGESGCGKSTLARAILRLVPVSDGSVSVLGHSIADLDAEALHALRSDLQIVFQDPLAALNPRMTVGDIVAEPLWTHRPQMPRDEARREVADVLERVGLSGRELNRYPHEFSGGQCQRIGIARALILRPKLVICDEPVSALDVSIQAQIVALLRDLREAFGLSLIFIAHDLAVVRQISDRVLVMYLGRTMEIARAAQLYGAPRHPYTRALIGSVPIPDPVAERRRQRELLSGDLPSPIHPPDGCCFRTRCRFAAQRCSEEVPQLREFDGSLVACHRAEELTLA